MGFITKSRIKIKIKISYVHFCYCRLFISKLTHSKEKIIYNTQRERERERERERGEERRGERREINF